MKPVIKWVGGKRQLLPDLKALMPSQYQKYYEPFVGGGALWLDVMPQHAIIGDANHCLINMYQVIQNNTDELLAQLAVYQQNNSKDYYLEVRSLDRNSNTFTKLTSVQKAARLIYMLRVDYNGLYRVNKKGQFNVPYGRYHNPDIINHDAIIALSNYLRSNDITLMTGDFAATVSSAKSGDFVYFDPPYIPVNMTSSFTSYTATGFNMASQKRLAVLFFELGKRDVKVMLSNSDTPLTRELYQDANIHVVQAKRAINSVASKRGAINELIVTNY